MINSDFVDKHYDLFISVDITNEFSVEIKCWKDQSLFSFLYHIQSFLYNFSISYFLSSSSISMNMR